jgi:hypothetical protein
MTPAAFQFIVSAITDVDGNDGRGRATDVVVTVVTAVAAVGALYARLISNYSTPYKPSNNMYQTSFG